MGWKKKNPQELNDKNTQLAFVKGPHEHNGAWATFKAHVLTQQDAQIQKDEPKPRPYPCHKN